MYNVTICVLTTKDYSCYLKHPSCYLKHPFSPGLLELNLNFMPKANKFAKSVSLDDLPDNEKGKPVPMVSLFDQKNVKGWWPMYEEGGPDTPRELTVSNH